jgi:succinate-semialdehyde dehydrogenase/glutarate-semialdehyde dehydrogenase
MSTLPIKNPRTGKYDYEIELLTTEAIHANCLRLRSGQSDWYLKGIDHRIKVMQQWKTAVTSNKDEIVDRLCEDTGRYHESVLEVNLLLSSIDRWCHIGEEFFSLNRKKTTSIPFIHIQQDEVPYPLVGVISPWNFPLLLSIIDALPALIAGCAVIVKPSEVTPRFIESVLDTIREIPELEAVFHYIEGDGRTGAALIQEVDLICFTGSVATGRIVYEACAEAFIPCFLELGGKDAALVFEGADLDLATSSILWGSTVNNGHSCLSIERVYVQETIYDEFVSQLVEKAKKVKLALESPKEGHLGPIISDRQVKIINEHLKDALENGAHLACGVDSCIEKDETYWCPPTVLTHVRQEMKIIQEETFGPIIPIQSFRDTQEAIDLADGTIFGLSGAVFARDNDTALSVARQMTAGALSINDCALTAIIHEGEKNAFKMSGIGGTRMGPGAIRRFMRQRAFIIKESNEPSGWWYAL